MQSPFPEIIVRTTLVMGVKSSLLQEETSHRGWEKQDLKKAFLILYLPPVLAVITRRLTVVWLNTLRWLAWIGFGLLASFPMIFNGNNAPITPSGREHKCTRNSHAHSNKAVFTLTIAIDQWIGPRASSLFNPAAWFLTKGGLDMEHLDPDKPHLSTNKENTKPSCSEAHCQLLSL